MCERVTRKAGGCGNIVCVGIFCDHISGKTKVFNHAQSTTVDIMGSTMVCVHIPKISQTLGTIIICDHVTWQTSVRIHRFKMRMICDLIPGKMSELSRAPGNIIVCDHVHWKDCVFGHVKGKHSFLLSVSVHWIHLGNPDQTCFCQRPVRIHVKQYFKI